MNLQVNQVIKSYGSLKALENVNLDLTCGIYALLGPNGAGKSTLMNLITQNLMPDHGEILFNGENIYSMGKRYRSLLGFMPQHQKMYEQFTASRFLWYIAALKGMSKKDASREIDRVLELVNLSSKKNEKISSFSGGMKQRLLIAQAILNDPLILILDEPTAGLDPQERVRIRSIITRISKEKIILYATHVVSDIEGIADRILLLKQGHLIADQPPAELMKSLTGKVHEASVSAQQLEEVQKKYLTGAVRQIPDGFLVRLICDEQPAGIQSSQTPASLEDVYLSYFRE